MSFLQPGSLDCTIASHNSAVGEVYADMKSKLIEDGEMLVPGEASTAADVSCVVAPNGSLFDFEASESAAALSLALSVNGLSPAATKDNPSKGVVYYQSPATANAFTQQDCAFYFTSPQSVSKGQVWLTFECDKIAQAADNVCELAPSFAAFEQCLTATN